MKEFMTTYSGIIQLVAVLVITGIALLVRKKVAVFTANLIEKHTKFEFNEERRSDFEKAFRPVNWLFTVIVFQVAFEAILVNNKDSYKSVMGIKLIELINKVNFNIIYLIITGFIITNVLNFFTHQYKKNESKLAENLNTTMMHMLFKVLRYVVWIVIASMILSDLGYNVTGIFAGLGLGGVAIALAAQDTVSNLFGCLVIILDKPFEIKDWISTGSVEGIVEEINFRSTRIRTFDNALVAVPNSSLASASITNWSKMTKRKLMFYINLTYATKPETIKAIKQDLVEYLTNASFIDKNTVMVNLETMSSSSIDLRVDCCIKHTALKTYLADREEINYKVIEIVNAHGGDFAFPSQSIYIESTPKSE